MKHSLRFLAIFIILSGLVSCDNADNSDPVFVPVPDRMPAPLIATFNAALNGKNEVSPNKSTATGTAFLIYNETTKTFSIEVTYSGLTPTDGHIHNGGLGINGPIVFSFTNLTPKIIYTSPPLSETQKADLFANLYYVNLHSNAFSGGEIRGQLIGGYWDY